MITTEDRFRILGSYLYSEVMVKVQNSSFVDTLTPFVLHEYECGNMSDIQLTLYDLSDITDEDIKEVAKILISDECVVFEFDRGIPSISAFTFMDMGLLYRIEVYNDLSDIVVCINKEGIWHTCELAFTLHQECVDYLRSKGYMLPYKGINLFDAQIAIRKTR